MRAFVRLCGAEMWVWVLVHLRESIGAMMCVCVSEAHAYEVIDEGLMYLFSNVFLSVKAHEKLWVE